MDKLTVVNATPHAISIAAPQGEEILRTYPASGMTVRCATTSKVVGTVDGFPVVQPSFGEVSGLPTEIEGTVYIVSLVVATALKGQRSDLICPLTDASALRKDGQIVAVRGFQRI